MVWEKKDINPEAVKALSAKYGCGQVAASILQRRGITEGSRLLYYLEDDNRHQHNPYLLPGMDDAVERILATKEEAQSHGEKILVFGDRDVDGITGTALLTSFLRGEGFDAEGRLPRPEESYGLSIGAVEEAAREGVTLIITVDCGIANIAEAAHAASLGIDLIVTDHHTPKETLPAAYTIVNPKLEGSIYPFPNISGCAIAYKLTRALRFALTSNFYGEAIALFNVRPVSGAIVIEAARIDNLAVTRTLTENIVPGTVGIGDTRLADFLSSRQIFVWDAAPQKKMLAEAFGKQAEFHFFDIAPEIGKEMPGVAGKSLLRLREASAIARYSEKPLTELEVFCNLFVSFVQKRDKLLAGDDGLLQFAALGTLADILPLENENRLLVKAGLKSMSEKPRTGLANIIAKLDLGGKPISTYDVSWKIAPALNSAERMGHAEKALTLFLTDKREEREALSSEILKMNDMRKARGEEIWQLLKPLADENLERFNNAFAVAAASEAELPKPFTGLQANRLLSFFNLPALALSEGADFTTGSFRTPEGREPCAFTILESNADLFTDEGEMWGGHPYAAGFTLKKSKLPELLSRLQMLCASIEPAADSKEARVVIDAELPHAYLTPDIFKIIDRLEPYGTAFPELTFLSRGLKVEDLSFIGSDASHVKFTLNSGAHKWPCVYWGAAEKVGKDRDFALGDRVDAVFHLSRDYWGGKERARMLIVDVKRAESAK